MGEGPKIDSQQNMQLITSRQDSSPMATMQPRSRNKLQEKTAPHRRFVHSPSFVLLALGAVSLSFRNRKELTRQETARPFCCSTVFQGNPRRCRRFLRLIILPSRVRIQADETRSRVAGRAWAELHLNDRVRTVRRRAFHRQGNGRRRPFSKGARQLLGTCEAGSYNGRVDQGSAPNRLRTMQCLIWTQPLSSSSYECAQCDNASADSAGPERRTARPLFTWNFRTGARAASRAHSRAQDDRISTSSSFSAAHTLPAPRWSLAGVGPRIGQRYGRAGSLFCGAFLVPWWQLTTACTTPGSSGGKAALPAFLALTAAQPALAAGKLTDAAESVQSGAYHWPPIFEQAVLLYDRSGTPLAPVLKS